MLRKTKSRYGVSEQFVVEKSLQGFPWRPYAATDSVDTALECAVHWAERGWHARIIDQRQAEELQPRWVFRASATFVMNLATLEERAYQAEPRLAVRLAHQADGKGDPEAPVRATDLQYWCGEWAAYKEGLTEDQVRAVLRRRQYLPSRRDR